MLNFKLNKTRKDIIQSALPMFRDQSNESELIESRSEPKYGGKDYSYIPIYAVPNAVTEALVGQSPAPRGYQADKDIGEKAVKDDWREYLDSQDKLKKLILLLLLLFLIVPLLGRSRRRRKYSPLSRYCCTIFLVLVGLLMLSLKSSVDCYSQYNSGKSKGYYLYKSTADLYDINYNQLLKGIEAPVLAHDEVMKNLSKLLKNMQEAKPLLENLSGELTVAKGLAIRFRDALRAVKQNLKVFLNVLCNQEECRDFYRDNEIGMLDEGCLRYDRLSPTEDFTKSIEEILAVNLVNYPLLAAQKIAKAEEKPKEGDSPASALRGKLGPMWYQSTLGWLLLLLFLPLFLLIALLVTLFSAKHGRRMLCAFLIAGIIFFALSLILVLFFLVHGSLAHQIRTEKGSKKSNDHIGYLPRLRTGDVLQQSVRNESLNRALVLKELYGKKDVRESLDRVGSARILDSQSQAATVDQKLLAGNLLSYNSSNFTWHLCRELVPEPKPGPLPGLISRLDNLTRNVGSSPFLLKQTNYLRAAHRELGKPLAGIVQRLRDKLRQLNHLLSGGYGSFSEHMSRLLEKIKQSDSRHDVKKVSDEVTGNISYFVDSVPDNDTKYGTEGRTPNTSLKLDANDDLFRRIANPMNAIWFWLLVFTLLIIPALCCSNCLRRRLSRNRYVSQDTLLSCGGENFVAHSTLPRELESHCHCYRYLPVCEETCCDDLTANVYCEYQC